ncbi:DUF3429 domain-containing protein [Methylophaga sp. OBS3]|uniref:DUF3429 domain-containing protein n=1 Tax=Methylophaga sp. OBS3 TaxID=2991934 RepID=UPI0022543A96|nr:DUF3429 domain-containing protein [Methylophaga sp. OBS3]MCX4190462.1 DUF3429 domain-containing protein [Methylophaga sp. OBS3]
MTRLHQLLGYAGLIPFVGLAIISMTGIYPNSSEWLLTYAALILSFLGGLLWVITMQYELPKHVPFVSVGLMLWAWCWLLWPTLNWFWLAAWSFLGLWLYEKYYISMVYSAEFIRLRGQLSLIAALSLMATALVH